MGGGFRCPFLWGRYGSSYHCDNRGGCVDSIVRLIKKFGLLSLLFVSAFAHADRDADACSAYFTRQNYPSSLSYLRAVPYNVQPDGSHGADCHYAENGAGDYTVFSVVLGPTPTPPPPPPPSCSIGTPYPSVSWAVGYRTGPDANSPFVGGKAPAPADVMNQQFCTGSCAVIVDQGPGQSSPSVQLQPQATPNGYYPVVATANFTSNGAACAPSPGQPLVPGPGVTSPVVADPAVPSVGKGACPPGTTSGGIDSGGTPICIGTGTPSTSKSATVSAATTVSNADGSSTTTQKVSNVNQDGSVTTTTTATNTDGSGNRTVTINNNTGAASNGLPGKSDTGKAGAVDPAKADPVKDFCTLHPELNACKNSSVSGSCEATSCSGDAIQCAQLRTQQMALCEQEKETDLGKAAAALSGDSMTGLPSAKTATQTDIGQTGSSLDSSGFAGSGACFSDKTVSIMGRSVTIGFSVVCSYLGYLKYVVLLIAMLGAYKIIGGALLRET